MPSLKHFGGVFQEENVLLVESGEFQTHGRLVVLAQSEAGANLGAILTGVQ